MSGVNINIGGGFTGLLTVLFIGLKLTGYIDWSWWIVFLPILIGISITLFVLFIILRIVRAIWL